LQQHFLSDDAFIGVRVGQFTLSEFTILLIR